MEKVNFLTELAKRGFNPTQNEMAISLGMLIDDNLYQFFAKQAVLLIYIKEHNETPDSEQIAKQMFSCVQSASSHLAQAVDAYQDYLNRGDKAIAEGMAGAMALSALASAIGLVIPPDASQEEKDRIFNENFGDFFKKAE